MKQPIRLYLDANILILMVEGGSPEPASMNLLLAALDTQKVQAITSELSIAEVLVKPLSMNSKRYVRVYMELFSEAPGFEVVPIARALLERSAEIRATIGGKLADSIHVATAEAAAASHVLTQDVRIRAPGPLGTISLSDVPALLGRWYSP